MGSHQAYGLCRRLFTVRLYAISTVSALIMACLVFTSCAGSKKPVSEPASRTAQLPAPAPVRSQVPSWGNGRQVPVNAYPQFFTYLDNVPGDTQSARDFVIHDFAKREYKVVEERVLSGRSVSTVFKDLGISNNIFVLICEGDKANLKYSIAATDSHMLTHYGVMYGFPVLVIKGPVTSFHHVNIGFAFLHDEEGASLDAVKQVMGLPILKDGTTITILRLRPTFFGLPM